MFQLTIKFYSPMGKTCTIAKTYYINKNMKPLYFINFFIACTFFKFDV